MTADPRVGLVRERHPDELERGRARTSRPRGGGRRRHDLRRSVEQAEDPLGGRHRPLHHRVLGAEVADRQEEAIRVLDERDEGAEGERLGHDPPASVPDQERQRDRAQSFHRGVERGLPTRRAEERSPIIAVEASEPVALVALPHEELDHRHALERFLEKPVETRQPPAHLAIGVARVEPEVHGDQRQRRHDREGHEGQAPVDPEHHRDHPDQRDHVGHDREEARGERLAHCLDVAEHARHETPDRVAVEEPRLQGHEVAEDRFTQIMDDPLSGELHQVAFDRPQAIENQEHDDVQAGDPRQTEPIRLQDVIVDRDLQEPRLRELGQGEHREEQH